MNKVREIKFVSILSVVCFFSVVFLTCISLAQDVKPFTHNFESRYFDFWQGTWHRFINGKVDTAATWFKVRRDAHQLAFNETWRMVIDSTMTMRATAIRAWDKINIRWMYVWSSDNGLFQVWEGRKVGDDWYIYREFDINGDKYLSRQAWIPTGKNTLRRISQKSYDNGETWQLRFEEFYQKTE
jgi:hypothetical protein